MVAQFLRISSEPVPDLGTLDISRGAVACPGAGDGARRGGPARLGRQVRCGARRHRASDRVEVDEMALVEATEDSLLAGPGPRTSATRRTSGTPPTSVGPATAPPTPATKFRPPRRPQAQVLRPRLIDALRAGDRRRLIVIHAPAGYGKTTLAAQWAEELARDGVKIGVADRRRQRQQPGVVSGEPGGSDPASKSGRGLRSR